MTAITITANGRPWIICGPEIGQDMTEIFAAARAAGHDIEIANDTAKADQEEFDQILRFHNEAGGHRFPFFGYSQFNLFQGPEGWNPQIVWRRGRLILLAYGGAAEIGDRFRNRDKEGVWELQGAGQWGVFDARYLADPADTAPE